MLAVDPKGKRAEAVRVLSVLVDGADPEKWKQTWDAHANLPIAGVLPGEVIEMCAGLGGRVSTLEEWLWAAWGGREDRLYPWGKAEYGPTRANLTEAARVFSGDPDVVDKDGFNSVAPVGSYPRGAGRWGHLDLAGNLEETVFPTLPHSGSWPQDRTSADRAYVSHCGLDFTYEDETAPESVFNFKTCEREPRNETCKEETFRDWRLFPCHGPYLTRAQKAPYTTQGFRCAADPAEPTSPSEVD